MRMTGAVMVNYSRAPSHAWKHLEKLLFRLSINFIPPTLLLYRPSLTHFTFLSPGIASTTDTFNIYYAERCIWHIIFKINGTPGHGSLLLKDTAGEKLRNFLDQVFDYRASQVAKLNNNPELTIGDVTTVNITMIEGGVLSNVIPPDFTIMTDFRLAVDVNHDEFEEMFKHWCTEAGENIEYEWDLKDPFIPPTKLDESNIYWHAFKAAVDEL